MTDAMNTALAVFVKTPGRSPVKTRLAATLGAAAAREVYAESLRLLRRRLRAAALAGVAVHWAVAEQAAVTDECWSDFPALWTGEGSLGQRLHQVYTRLRGGEQGGQARRVILIGADCPQLSAQTILYAARQKRAVFGAARDGGFYLFASSDNISRAQWLAPTYSGSETLAQLRAALAGGRDKTQDELLSVLTDIDDVESLARCISEFEETNVETNVSEETATLRRLLSAAS